MPLRIGWSGTRTFMYLDTAGKVDSLGSLLVVPLYMKTLPWRPELFPKVTCSPIITGIPVGGGGVSADAPLPEAMNRLMASSGFAGKRNVSAAGNPAAAPAGPSSL